MAAQAQYPGYIVGIVWHKPDTIPALARHEITRTVVATNKAITGQWEECRRTQQTYRISGSH